MAVTLNPEGWPLNRDRPAAQERLHVGVSRGADGKKRGEAQLSFPSSLGYEDFYFTFLSFKKLGGVES
jgi:hypothetical protein